MTIGAIGHSVYTASAVNLPGKPSELSGLGSTNDAVERRDLQDLANVGKDIKIPENIISSQAKIRNGIGSLLDIRG
ncbi:MAG: hypothetical protein PHG82_02355 [Candidatus Gracilibacteria bacterium]|nr:hypothetical protein [Candidatus Gracilibacteria bacterium]